MSYFRATDPYPLEHADQSKLHEFYEYLAAGRLVTSVCTQCRRLDWPPRLFCPECAADGFDWVDLPPEGTVHAFTIQETGVPAGFKSPLFFAIVKIADLRIFAPIVGTDAAALAVGMHVRLKPVRVTDDVKGRPRHLVAFEPAAGAQSA